MRDFKKFTSNEIKKVLKEIPESRRNWMLWLFESAGKNNSNNEAFQFWQQENHPIALTTPDFTKQKLNYIHNNPVTARIVDSPERYVYSSAKDYYGEKGLLPISFID
jgi:hypothetical protein